MSSGPSGRHARCPYDPKKDKNNVAYHKQSTTVGGVVDPASKKRQLPYNKYFFNANLICNEIIIFKKKSQKTIRYTSLFLLKR